MGNFFPNFCKLAINCCLQGIGFIPFICVAFFGGFFFGGGVGFFFGWLGFFISQ